MKKIYLLLFCLTFIFLNVYGQSVNSINVKLTIPDVYLKNGRVQVDRAVYNFPVRAIVEITNYAVNIPLNGEIRIHLDNTVNPVTLTGGIVPNGTSAWNSGNTALIYTTVIDFPLDWQNLRVGYTNNLYANYTWSANAETRVVRSGNIVAETAPEVTISGNSISSDQTIAYNTKPQELKQATGVTLTGGSASSYKYQWQRSATNSGEGSFTDIAGATGATLNFASFAPLTQTSYYRRLVGTPAKRSNVIKITVTGAPPPPAPPVPAQPFNFVGIKKNQTSSGATEIHTLSGSSGFQSFILQRSTAFPLADNSWDFKIIDYDKDGQPDLVGIKKSGTGSGKVEIHVATAANNFGSLSHQAVTPFPLSLSGWEYEIADYDRDGRLDLVGIMTNNASSGKVEIHVATAANNFAFFTNQMSTAFPLSSSGWEYEIVDFDADAKLDLVGIKTSSTSTGKVEIHVATAANNFAFLTNQVPTAFALSTSDWEYEVINYDGDAKPDLVGILKNNTGSGKVETHVAVGAGNYSSLSYQIATAFAQTNGNWEFAMHNSASSVAGGRKANTDLAADQPAGADEILTSTSLVIYPNPASAVLNVSIGAAAAGNGGLAEGEVRLYNAQKLVLKRNGIANGKVTLPVHGLPAGLYYLHVRIGKEVYKKHVMIQQ